MIATAAQTFKQIPAYNLKTRLKFLKQALGINPGVGFVGTEYGEVKFFIVAPERAQDLDLPVVDEMPISRAYHKNSVTIGDLDCLFLTYHGRRRVALIHPRHQQRLINTA